MTFTAHLNSASHMSRAQKPYEVSGHHSTEHGVRPSHLYISLFRTIQKQREKFLFTAWQGKAGAWLLRYVGKWGDILSRTLILSSTMKPKKKKSPGDSDSKESACIAEDLGCIPGLGRSPGGGHGNPLHYSCLENPMDRGAWCTIRSMGSQESDAT